MPEPPTALIMCVFCTNIHELRCYGPEDFICEDCYLPTDTGPGFDDLPEPPAFIVVELT